MFCKVTILSALTVLASALGSPTPYDQFSLMSEHSGNQRFHMASVHAYYGKFVINHPTTTFCHHETVDTLCNKSGPSITYSKDAANTDQQSRLPFSEAILDSPTTHSIWPSTAPQVKSCTSIRAAVYDTLNSPSSGTMSRKGPSQKAFSILHPPLALMDSWAGK
jgi:hypothetical protein